MSGLPMQEAVAIVNDPRESDERRVYVLDILAGMLASGEWSGDATAQELLTDDAIDAMRECGMFDVATSVNVALAYGDLSGLKFHGYGEATR